MKFRLLPAANRELAGAANYYERERSGAGEEFLEGFDEAIERLREYSRVGPVAGVVRGVEYRELLLVQFPYRLIYTIECGDIVIVAVAHQRRRPAYWRYRVEESAQPYDIPFAA